jgi:hypothetical protein
VLDDPEWHAEKWATQGLIRRGDIMDSLVTGSLRIDARVGRPAGAIQLLWMGRSNDRNPAVVLAPYFSQVLASASAGHVPVELHFERLEHFNSSTITSIIKLVEDARRGGVKLTLLYDKDVRWQRMSLEPLRVFANDLFELRPV